jgi:tetratricopeptide (TPR) repeat protein
LRVQPTSRFPGEPEYAFKHDLIREVAYGQLPHADRRQLHGQVTDWLEEAAGERSEEVLDLLAHHAVQAEQHDRALGYLSRAAERACRAAAHREEAALLERAITIGKHSNRVDLVASFHARRGRAFASIALWVPARQELEAALAGLPADRREERAEVLVDLASACNWSLDTPATRSYATESLFLAEAVGRADVSTDARFWLSWATGSDGAVALALDQYEAALCRADELGVALAPGVLPLYSTTLCWAGRFPAAIERARLAVQVGHQANDTNSTILAMQVLGLALAGTGRYDEASRTFDEALRFGRDHGIGPFLARSIAMSAGFHLDVFDYAGHASIVAEARELARSVNFPPAFISASIDLLLNLARLGEVGPAEQIAAELADAVERGAAWHGWLWRLRFAQARAEIALARGKGEEVIRLTEEVLGQSRGRRPKYQALGMVTRARGLATLGRTRSAITDLHQAVKVARSVSDPALFLHTAVALLELDGDDALMHEAQSVTGAILSALPNEPMRERFRTAEPVRRLATL